MNNESRHKPSTEKNTNTQLQNFYTNSEKTLKTPDILKYSKNDLKVTSYRPPTYEDT